MLCPRRLSSGYVGVTPPPAPWQVLLVSEEFPVYSRKPLSARPGELEEACACAIAPVGFCLPLTGCERQSVLDVNLLAQGRSPHIAVSDPVIRKDDAFIAYSIDWMCVRSTAALGRSVAARSRAVARQGQRYSRRCRAGPAKWKRGALLMCCGATFGFPRSRVVATVF